jgi:hypothetical protein
VYTGRTIKYIQIAGRTIKLEEWRDGQSNGGTDDQMAGRTIKWRDGRSMESKSASASNVTRGGVLGFRNTVKRPNFRP